MIWQLSSITWLLESSKWQLCWDLEVVIYINLSTLKSFGYSVADILIGTKYWTNKTVSSVVSPWDNFVNFFEFKNWQNWAEDLLSRYFHVIFHISEQCRLYKIALSVNPSTTCNQSCTLFMSWLNIAKYFIHLLLRYHWPASDVRLSPSSKFCLSEYRTYHVYKLIMDIFVDKKSAWLSANLTCCHSSK